MVPLLLLPLLCGDSLQEKPGYELRLKESVTAQEGLCVHVPCSFSYPWNPQLSSDVLHIYWYRSGDNIIYSYPVASNDPYKPVKTETAIRFRLLEDPRTNSCSLSISNARRSNTGSYFFRVERGSYVKYSYTDKKLHLQVTDLPVVPDIHIPEPLESGHLARLTCNLPGSCEGGRPLTFSWVGAALDSLGPQALRSSVLTLTLRPRDHGTNLTCQVTQQGYWVTSERTILLNVSYAPRLTISFSKGNSTEQVMHPDSALSDADMVPLLLLPLLWGGSLQEKPGYELRLKESVRVQEGLCVHVPCSFSYPWNLQLSSDELYIYWYRNRDSITYDYPVASNDLNKPAKTETANRFRLLEDPRTNSCSLSISNARRSDTGRYFFRVERGDVKYTYADKKLHLQVTDLPEVPDIHIPEPLESGRPTRLTCNLPGSCEGGRSLTFSWVGAALDLLGPQALRSSVLTLTLRPRDHGTNLTCQVTQQGYWVTSERTVLLNVSYAPRLTISFSKGNSTALKTLSNHMSLSVLEGQFLLLVCEADSNPPAMLSWSQEGKALSPSQLSAPGVLQLPHVRATDGGVFTCQAQHPLGSQNVSFSLSVQRSPSSCKCVAEEQQGSWPLVLTLIRGALMGAGFLLTYGLTWTYYIRYGGPQRTRPRS